ncbi:hypothetical protein [Anaerotignum sp.]|uniref:hypothetical protein n=1 Tax=Anaerotignum sp. TaxID=2039241 RepID=UPI002896D351|nr:hypothetical protein [Anaerotignum sp.]
MSNKALQIEQQLDGMVGSAQNVIFNSTVFTAGNIIYNDATGIVTFMEAGLYTVNWWIATQSSAGQGAVFSLISSQGESIRGASPIKTGEVTGFGIIEVVSAPVTVSLVNSGSADFYYSSIVPVKAALLIVEEYSTVQPSYVQLFDRNYTNELPSLGALNLSNDGINPVYSTAGYSLTTTTVKNDTLNLPGPGLYHIELSLRASFFLPVSPPPFGSTYQILFNLLNETNSNIVDLVYNGIIPNDPNAILENQLSIQLLYNTAALSPSLRVLLSNFNFNLAFENKLSVFDIILIVQKI